MKKFTRKTNLVVTANEDSTFAGVDTVPGEGIDFEFLVSSKEGERRVFQSVWDGWDVPS
jgi:hypothetical protein